MAGAESFFQKGRLIFVTQASVRYNTCMNAKTVLVGVLKSPRDLKILLEEKWYRIPLAFLPKRRFTHLAFYQPLVFGPRGKRIIYYARVAKRAVARRSTLLPEEPRHPRAHDAYLKCSFRSVKKLPKPIQNIIPRRVSFGFTDLKTLCSAKDILELYHVPPTEQIIRQALQRLQIPATPEYGVMHARRRYRLDLAVFCRNGSIGIECDNRKAHTTKPQRQKDMQKDRALKRLGWRVIRLAERDIIEDLDSCLTPIQQSIRSLGGIISPC